MEMEIINPPTVCSLSTLDNASRVGMHVFVPSHPYESGLVLKLLGSGSRVQVRIGRTMSDFKASELMVLSDQTKPIRPKKQRKVSDAAEGASGEQAGGVGTPASPQPTTTTASGKTPPVSAPRPPKRQKKETPVKGGSAPGCARAMPYDPYSKPEKKPNRSMKKRGASAFLSKADAVPGGMAAASLLETAKARFETSLITEQMKDKSTGVGRAARADQRRMLKDNTIGGMDIDTIKCREPKLR